MRQRERDEPDDRQQQQLDGVLHLLGVDLVGLRRRRPAAVRHEDVDAAVGLDGGADGALEVGRLPDVAGDGETADAVPPPARGRRGGART